MFPVYAGNVLTLQGKLHALVGDGAIETFDGKPRLAWLDRRRSSGRVLKRVSG